MGRQALQATSGLRFVAGVDQVDEPGRLLAPMSLRLAGAQIDRDIVVEREEVEEVLLDDFALVAEGDDEFLEPVSRVQVEKVPENRLTADLHHGLWPERSLLGESRSETTSK